MCNGGPASCLKCYDDPHSTAKSCHGRCLLELAVKSACFAADEQVEEDSTVDDLLACLGEEEQKVERLSEKLRSLGIDPQSLIGDIGQQPTEDFA